MTTTEPVRSDDRPEPRPKGLNPAAIERAIHFQREVFGDRLLTPPISEIIEEARHERDEELSKCG